MKPIYTLLIAVIIGLNGCQKDFDTLIIGDWALEEMYDTEGKKITVNGKFYGLPTGFYEYFTVSMQFDECVSGEDSCTGNATTTFYYTDKEPYDQVKTHKYKFTDNSNFVIGSTPYKIAKLTKKKLEIYPVNYEKSIRTYSRK